VVERTWWRGLVGRRLGLAALTLLLRGKVCGYRIGLASKVPKPPVVRLRRGSVARGVMSSGSSSSMDSMSGSRKAAGYDSSLADLNGLLTRFGERSGDELRTEGGRERAKEADVKVGEE
jgi:hypothetical protein